MLLVNSPAEMRAWSKQARTKNNSLALVPTMGYFHEGHLQLMRKARELADQVVVSIFVNPLQFGAHEDLTRYPRDLARDEQLAARTAVDVLFCPSAEAMYPPLSQTKIRVEELSRGLCGESRPGHFEGVATVVAKLFHITAPDWAIFGEKDFQQLAVIRQMVRDLDWDVAIFAHPTVREPDGLAMSSRNAYLSADERKSSALCLWKAIELARREVAKGERDAPRLLAKIESLIASFPNTEVDYVRLVDETSLKPQDLVTAQSRLVMAVKVGQTRLIDNARICEDL